MNTHPGATQTTTRKSFWERLLRRFSREATYVSTRMAPAIFGSRLGFLGMLAGFTVFWYFGYRQLAQLLNMQTLSIPHVIFTVMAYIFAIPAMVFAGIIFKARSTVRRELLRTFAGRSSPLCLHCRYTTGIDDLDACPECDESLRIPYEVNPWNVLEAHLRTLDHTAIRMHRPEKLVLREMLSCDQSVYEVKMVSEENFEPVDRTFCIRIARLGDTPSTPYRWSKHDVRYYVLTGDDRWIWDGPPETLDEE
jgi:hypothetical protein